MAAIRMSGVQMPVSAKLDDNIEKILYYIRHSDADFLVFPEMSLTGYHGNFGDKGTHNAWRQISEACRQSYTTALIGTGCREDNEAFIQTRIYSDDGAVLGTHEKLIPPRGDRELFQPGSELRTFQHMGLDFGCLITNDLWVTPGFGPYPDPRLSYQLGERGAQVIFHSVNSGHDPLYEDYHLSNLVLRAMESNVYIVTVNAAYDGGPNNSPTGIVSPEGEWVTHCAREGEHVFVMDLDLDTE